MCKSALLLLAFFGSGLRAMAQAPTWQSAMPIAAVATATTADESGNIYLAGNFSGTVSFGAIRLTSSGFSNVFVAKWSPATNDFLWAKQAGGNNIDAVTALAVSGTSVYLAGEFDSPTASFGATTLTNASASGDVFVAKLTDAGASASFVWAQRGGGASLDRATALAVSGRNVYVAGYFFSASAGFGGSTLTNADASVNTKDVFLAKLTDAGTSTTYAWAYRAGGARNDAPNTLAAAGTNVYVAGSFDGNTATFGGTTLTNFAVNSGYQDGFVTKMTDAGTSAAFTWAKGVGSTDSDAVTAVAVNGNSLYLAGFFYGPTGRFDTFNVTNAGGADIFVAKLTDAGSSGGVVWVQRAGGADDDSPTSLLVNGPGLYVGGSFGAPNTGGIGTASFGTTTLTSVGGPDIFVAKLLDSGSSGTFASALPAGGRYSDRLLSLALSGNAIYAATVVATNASFGSQAVTGPDGTAAYVLAALTDPLVPTLTSVAPASGPAGTVLTLDGTQLGGTTAITFARPSGNTVVSGFSVNAAGTQITGVVVPGGATTGNLTVTTPYGQSNGLFFTPAPATGPPAPPSA
jgi:hypothetical protein